MLRRGGHDGAGGGGGHDGAGAMRWLLTYADLVTLLMVFFVVLYSISKVDQAKYIALALSLRSSFTAEQSGNAVIRTSLSAPQIPDMLPEQNSLQNMKNELQAALKRAGLDGKVDMALTSKGLVVSFSEQAAFFQAARAELQPQFETLLRGFAPILAKAPDAIEVDGFTDDLPLRSSEFATSWELSSRRATNVVRFLTEQAGLDPKRFSAVAYGEWWPKYPNVNQVNREKNRRVDLIILRHAPGPPWATPETPPPPIQRASIAGG